MAGTQVVQKTGHRTIQDFEHLLKALFATVVGVGHVSAGGVGIEVAHQEQLIV
jgi:hypothetical protein